MIKDMNDNTISIVTTEVRIYAAKVGVLIIMQTNLKAYR